MRVVEDDEDDAEGVASTDVKVAILRVRMKPQTLVRIRAVAEYERVKHREKGKGRCMSTLVLGWILDNLDNLEDEMLLAQERMTAARAIQAAEEALIEHAPRDFTGSPPKRRK